VKLGCVENTRSKGGKVRPGKEETEGAGDRKSLECMILRKKQSD
jgi:hypothetical protein